jgi:hypothetical protein
MERLSVRSDFAELALPKLARRRGSQAVAWRRNAFAAWLALIGLIVPAAEVTFNMGGVKFTVGRLGIILLLLPAFVTLLQKSRRLVLSDVFVCATASWMLAAGVLAPGSESFSSSAAEGIEFAGGYFVARAFFFGPMAIQTFIKVLRILACASIILAIADSISGRLIVHEMVAPFFNAQPIDYQLRGGMVRAASTFDHAILFGAFSCLVGTILLHSEQNAGKRIFYVGLCFLGCILSWSSSSLMAFSIVLAAYTYNRIMHGYAQRWAVFWSICAALLLVFFAASNNPMGWIISHLTLEPESGYYRLMIWDAALAKLSDSWYFGFGFNPFNSWILDTTVDSIWLVFALRFGVPAVVLLFLSNVTSFLQSNRSRWNRNGNGAASNGYMANMSTAFTTVLCMFMFIGLTVHFWNYMWIFWGICIGTRASLREWCLAEGCSDRLASSSINAHSARARYR